MIVVDASAMIGALVGEAPSPGLLTLIGEEPLAAPHLLDVEVLSVLRGLTRDHRLDDRVALAARQTFFSLSLARYETSVLAERTWELRHRCTAYDAGYLALAELVGAPLVTADEKLLAAGSDDEILLVDALAP